MQGEKKPLRPRWKSVVDVETAYAAVGDVLDVWREVARWPDAAPFSGGVWDEWPRRVAAGVAFLRGESEAVKEFLLHEAKKKEVKRG